jgi:D-aminoacyl-tRNA deacylase
MIGIIYSDSDTASKNMAQHIIDAYQFGRAVVNGRDCYRREQVLIYRSDVELVDASFVDDLDLSLVYFLSKHRSAEGVASFTTHAEGNWASEARIGGKPKELSVSAPREMLTMINRISSIEASGVSRTYEATHHGPLIKTPSMFVELGGDERTVSNKELAGMLGDAVHAAITDEGAHCNRVVIGIGSTHYPGGFTRLAVEKGYAFSHIMPRYAIMNDDGSDNTEMLEQAVERSKEKPEAALIEWKSINADVRNRVIKSLNAIGLEYERV